MSADGPALMAHILCCKYGYHLPLYRQSKMFANEGIDLSGSLMAGWVGKCSKLLERVSGQIACATNALGLEADFPPFVAEFNV